MSKRVPRLCICSIVVACIVGIVLLVFFIIKPDDAHTHYNLGATYTKDRRYTEAIEPFKQAIRIEPDYGEAQYNLGLTYAKAKRYTEAIEPFKQAIRIKPEDAKAHFCLGLVYSLVDDKGSALEEYKILKDLDKDLARKLLNLIDFPPSAPEWGLLNCEQGVALALWSLESRTSIFPVG